MDREKHIDNLIKAISDKYAETKKSIKGKIIKRGHTRSISTDVEDEIALFISRILGDDFKIYIDSTVTIEKKTNRPDFLIVKNDKVVALLEIKTNMGFCRDAKVVIEKIRNMHKLFSKNRKIECKFSISEETEEVNYDDNVELFLIALTSKNGGNEEQQMKNKSFAEDEKNEKKVWHYLLFNNWYDSLEKKEVGLFVDALSKIYK